MISMEMQTKIAEWRTKARDGTLTREEMKDAIQALRKDRGMAAGVSAKAKTAKTTKAKAANIDSDDLLAGLEGM